MQDGGVHRVTSSCRKYKQMLLLRSLRSKAAKSPKPKPKRPPRQARSRETVEAILQATTYILVRDGYRGLKQGRRIVVPGSANKVVAALVRLMPRGIALDVAATRREGGDR